MANIEKKMRSIIRRLDKAVDALAEMFDIALEAQGGDRGQRMDSLVRMKTELREYSEYLEDATWWKAGQSN